MAVRCRCSDSGATLLEIVIAMAIFAVAALALSSLLFSSQKLNEDNREKTVAMAAARSTVETMRNQEISQIFALYNDDSADDPAGLVAPGPGFPVAGLSSAKGDEDGLPGRIEFPTVAGSIREDIDDPLLELPHDLNRDGAIDNESHSADYKILPVTVIVEWAGVGRNNRIVYRTRFVEK